MFNSNITDKKITLRQEYLNVIAEMAKLSPDNELVVDGMSDQAVVGLMLVKRLDEICGRLGEISRGLKELENIAEDTSSISDSLGDLAGCVSEYPNGRGYLSIGGDITTHDF